ncbi:hypothetical protein AFGD_011175 [Aspergillus flavus]|nr:hypothetical protein AFGD_011175 [Aspergillus flavus]
MDTEVITAPADTNPAQLANQGLLLEEQYHCTGDTRTLCAAIGVFQKLLTITPQDDTRLPHFLEPWLRNARYIRDLVPAQGDLGETYSICRTVLELIGELKPIVSQAVQATDKDDSELIPRLERLGCRLHERHERTEDIETLQEIQQLGLQAMRLKPKVDTNMALLLYNSGKAYLLHWAQTEDKDALEKAIIVTRQSVECTPEGDDVSQIDSVAWGPAHAFRRAAQLVPNNHPIQSNSNALLRNAILVRFKARGDLQDIDSVLSASREAGAAGAGENDHDAWALYHLGSQLDFKYVNTGDVDCLHEAIQVCSQAIDLPGEDHFICAKILALRGQCLRELFEHTGDISELERAITDCKQAVEIMPEDHHALPGILQRLAFSS